MKPRAWGPAWLVVAATLLAAFSHLFRLLTLPPPAWVDEIWFALRARDLLHGGPLPVYYPTFWGGVHPLMVALTAGVMALGFEREIVASRVVSALAAVLAVPLAYACLDELWRGRTPWTAARRRWTAALAALILSNLLFVTVVSRVGTEPALALAAGLFSLWQMRRAQRTGGWRGWLWAGLAAGLAQYISLHARFILPVLGWMALHELALAGRAQRRRLLAGMGLMAGAAVLVALPLLVFFVREPEWILARARLAGSQPGVGSWIDNLGQILLSFGLRGDLNPRHNLPGRTMFDAMQTAGFWVGLAWAMSRLRRAAPARDLLVWAGVMLAPSLLTADAPQFERMIGLAAPAAALIALGWMSALRWIEARLGGVAGAARGVGVAWVAVSLSLNGYDYFVRYPATPELAEAMTTTPVELAHALIERARTEPVLVERTQEGDDVFAFEFLFPGSGVRRLDFRQCLPLVDRRPARTTYLVLLARDARSAQELLRAYPSAAVQHVRPEAAALMGEAALIEVPAGARAPAAARAAGARFDPGITLLGYTWSGPVVRAGESLFLTLYWKAERDVEADLTAFLHVGTGLADSPNVAQRDSQPCQGLYPTSQWRAGDVIPDGFAVTLPADAAPGDYPLAVGWYSYPSLERRPLLSADAPLPDDRAVIGTLKITAP